MRQSARIKSGKVVSSYGSSGVIKKKKGQVQKIISADRHHDNAVIKEPDNEIDIPNEQRSEDVGMSSENDLDTDDNEDVETTDNDVGVSNTEIDKIKKMDKEAALEHIKKNYSNPGSIICYSSVSGLKDLFKILSEEEIKNVLSTFETWSLMKSSRNPKKYNPFIAQHLRDVWQIDCISMKEIADQNSGINYLFCAIDVFR